MTNSLSIGDVVEAFGMVEHVSRNGMEGTVIGPVFDWYPHGLCVQVEWTDGIKRAAVCRCLRKKKPPREDLRVVSWDQCPWQPEKINV